MTPERWPRKIIDGATEIEVVPAAWLRAERAKGKVAEPKVPDAERVRDLEGRLDAIMEELVNVDEMLRVGSPKAARRLVRDLWLEHEGR